MAGIESGQQVLVYGASGSVGTFAVQIAKQFDAVVTGVCSTGNLDWVKDLGADYVIDYTQEDVTTGGERYDLIFDAVGKMMTGLSRSHFKTALTPGGAVVSVEMDYKERAEDLQTLAQLMADGAVRSVIDRRYSLEQIVEAHRYVEQGHKKGNVVITLEGAS
jgi:NADPH:quinone reductase-like Zn-dependent oxidoreductase